MLHFFLFARWACDHWSTICVGGHYRDEPAQLKVRWQKNKQRKTIHTKPEGNDLKEKGQPQQRQRFEGVMQLCTYRVFMPLFCSRYFQMLGLQIVAVGGACMCACTSTLWTILPLLCHSLGVTGFG